MNKDNQKKYINLRKEFTSFIYESFNYREFPDSYEIDFNFLLSEKIIFRPKIKIRKNKYLTNLSVADLEHFVFNIGMVELISYWKAACPPKIIVKPFSLNKSQIKFWTKIYYHGLGEFFYLNGIKNSIDDFVIIESKSDKVAEIRDCIFKDNMVIVPVGGGKDSVVTLELLKNHFEVIPFIMNPRKASLGTALAAGFIKDDILVVQRTIDPILLELNDQGFLNGHTPFSALLGFVTVLLAAMTGAKYIALSNESSANEPTVASGENHQYSKSFEFESDFRKYVFKNLSQDIEYFSFLRPLSEYLIARLFAGFEHHHSIFRSCNVGSKSDTWCCNCPKCLFTNIILSPFLNEGRRIQIFGEDLFSNKGLKKYFEELTGLTPEKPFECVGTVDEVRLSLHQTISNKPDELPFLLENYKTDIGLTKSLFERLYEEISTMDENHFLTEKFLNVLKSAINDK